MQALCCRFFGAVWTNGDRRGRTLSMLDDATLSGADLAPLPTSPDQLLERLDALGIPHQTYCHQPLFTVEESKALRGDLPGHHCKNLFLKDKKGRYWLVVALEDAVIALNHFDKVIGSARLTFASPERLFEVLGVRPGSVTPFALINDTAHVVRVILQKRMMEQDVVNYHPLLNNRTTGLAPADLLRFIRACGHEPEIVDFG